MKILKWVLAGSCLVMTGILAQDDIGITSGEGKLMVAPFSLTHNGKTVSSKGGEFAVAPTTPTGKSQTFVLKPHCCRPIYVYMRNKLPVRNIQSFKLFRLATPEVLLKEKTDYILAGQGAVCSAKKEMEQVKVRAEYTYLPERYDGLFLSLADGRLFLVPGVVRAVDAEEYIPATPAGCLRIANVVATGSALTVIPTWAQTPPVQPGSLDHLQAKIKAGETIRVLGYGDSITAVQKGRVTFTPGGVMRDRPELFCNRYPQDTRDRIERFDFKDGAGKVHCRLGWNWKLVEALKKRSGLAVEYYNAGIGSTTSKNAKSQGLDEARLAEALAVKADLVVLAFGMNELGSSQTEGNMSELVKRFKAAGADVVIMGVPLINGTRPSGHQRAWEKTNALLSAVATAQNCAFVDPRKINLGLKPDHVCSANLYNHPGMHELHCYGIALASVLKGL
jgi:lysophospholipase L1-like esterase